MRAQMTVIPSAEFLSAHEIGPYRRSAVE